MIKLQELVVQTKEEFKLSEDKCQKIIANIRGEIKDYVEKSKLKSLVVGVSGGLDSAVVAALCQEKYTGVPLIGLHIPLATTDTHSKFAMVVGSTYCSTYRESRIWEGEIKVINAKLQGSNDGVINCVDSEPHAALRQGNLKARLRMITLYDMARASDGLVLSTDNYSEYLAGFFTIFGDQGDFGPIQYVHKGLELPYIARVLGVREDIITQPPSDGLGVTEENTDEAQLGCNYETFDTVMVAYLQGTAEEQEELTKDPIAKQVIDRYRATGFKRIGAIGLSREGIGI
jgi:nicotinamide-nucleotide amidase